MIDTTITIPKDQKQGISSLELGLKILEHIAEYGKPITLKALAELSEMSPSRLHKYLVSLVKLGYISQQSDSKYTLATSSLKIGISALRLIDPIQSAFLCAEKLHREYDRTITVAIWNGNYPLVIKWLDSSRSLNVNIRLGSQLSPFTSASGRIFLAFLPDQRRQEIVDEFFANPPALPRHMGQPLNKSEFMKLLEEIREEKVCRFMQDYLPDINVVSAPIFDVDNNISSIINLLGQTSDTPVEKGSIYEQAVLHACQTATQQLRGYS
ncbi:transcriptional regulator, IclR family [Amphritea atlantica]|uniref:Transcriptional regulator, IclR family n=1 Tax=Amphritea atlantica TaxID=355243 RepID=A0A1H9FQP5_9GAMM|nr:IclR family transcriptional regulator [Amphritea atlantica]SEQ39813.1 transcriptional regulator, IclR family [Amphritea atlantica]